MGNEVAKNPLGEESRQHPGARRSLGFAQEALHMLLDGLLGDPEFQGDLFIGKPLEEVPDNGPPTRRQAKPRAGLRHANRLPTGDPIKHDHNPRLIRTTRTRDSEPAKEQGGR